MAEQGHCNDLQIGNKPKDFEIVSEAETNQREPIGFHGSLDV